MRRIFLGLVIILCSCNNNNDEKPAALKKQPLTGRWQLDSIDISNKIDTSEVGVIAAYLMEDDHYRHVQFGFSENGMLTEFDQDGPGSSARFELRGDSIALVEDEPQDIFIIKKLDASNLVLLSSDTVQLFFKRVKEK